MTETSVSCVTLNETTYVLEAGNSWFSCYKILKTLHHEVGYGMWVDKKVNGNKIRTGIV